MPKFDVRGLIEYSDAKFLPKVLVNRPGYRLVLLNLRKGQAVPEHANPDIVTVFAVTGHITFFDGADPVDLHAGEAVQIEPGVQHHLEAHEDSSLFVVAAGNAPAQNAQEKPAQDAQEPVIDVRQIPGPQRHPSIFSTFDGLPVGGSLIIVNDHDPVPLNRQMDSLRPGQAEWKYLVRGPELFKIQVTRIAPLAGSENSPTIQRDSLLGIRGA